MYRSLWSRLVHAYRDERLAGAHVQHLVRYFFLFFFFLFFFFSVHAYRDERTAGAHVQHLVRFYLYLLLCVCCVVCVRQGFVCGKRDLAFK